MPELATKADIVRLEGVIKRQMLQLTVRLGVLLMVTLCACAIISANALAVLT